MSAENRHYSLVSTEAYRSRELPKSKQDREKHVEEREENRVTYLNEDFVFILKEQCSREDHVTISTG